MDGAADYSVVLYEDGERVARATVTDTSCDWSKDMEDSYTYVRFSACISCPVKESLIQNIQKVRIIQFSVCEFLTHNYTL